MLLFFGTRGSLLGSTSTKIKCLECNIGYYDLFCVQRYFHLMWIPSFPTEKILGLTCVHCRHLLDTKNIDKDKGIKEFKKHFRAPLWMYGGGFLILGFGALFTFCIMQQQRFIENFMETPKSNYCLLIQANRKYYVPIKVDSIEDNLVHIQYHQYGYTSSFQSMKKCKELSNGDHAEWDEGDIPLEDFKKLKVMEIEKCT